MKIRALAPFSMLSSLTACSASCANINTSSIRSNTNSIASNDNLQRNYNVQQAPPVIVLFHGLNKDVSSLSNTKNQLERKFLHAKIEAFERDKQQNIKEQAQKAYQELKTKELYQRDWFLSVLVQGV